MTFGEELRKWRGKRLQKEAAALLDINIYSYRKYEYNQRTPYWLAQFEIRRRMAAATEQNQDRACNAPSLAVAAQARV